MNTDNAHRLIGRWKILSFDAEFKNTGARRPTYGERPKGYLAFFADGKMMAVITADEPRSAMLEGAKVLKSMLAYCGPYRVEGDRWITQIDTAWDERWVGGEQVRSFCLEDDDSKLVVTSDWQQRTGGSGPFRFLITWQRDSPAA